MSEAQTIFINGLKRSGYITNDSANERAKDFLAVSNTINDFSFSYKNIYESVKDDHIAVRNLVALSYNVVYVLAKEYDKSLYDGRNEYSCKTAKQLVHSIPYIADYRNYVKKERWADNLLYVKDMPGDEIGECFGTFIVKTHRTLQQMLARLAFYTLYQQWLKASGEKTVDAKLKAVGIEYPDFYRCPLI